MEFIKELFNDNKKIINNYQKDIDKIKKLSTQILDNPNFIENNKGFIIDKINKLKEKFNGLDYKINTDKEKINTIFENNKIELIALMYTVTIILEKADNDWKYIPYNTQLMGVLGILDNKFIEMKTGEGKSLVSFLAGIIKSLYGKPIHIVSINDYLTSRDISDFKLMSDFLDIDIGLVKEGLSDSDRQIEYSKNIVYVTHQEVIFDYLKDNMFVELDKIMIKDYYCTIIDEVDAILIDAAQTPIMIALPTKEDKLQYVEYKALAEKVSIDKDNFTIDKEVKSVTLTDKGITLLENILNVDNLFISNNYKYINGVENALKAKLVYINGEEYIVKDDKIVIIDRYTGRPISNRGFPAGIQQSVEVKENVSVSKDNKMLASITYQNFFKLYGYMTGMSGTIMTDKTEFENTYNVECLEIPRLKENKTIIHNDLFFRNNSGKIDYIGNLVKDLNKKGQPVLIGVKTVEKSIEISNKLNELGLEYEILNASNHEKEAEIIANAGNVGKITIATSIAGRGTDIKISKEANKLGGLFVIGVERNEGIRLDNQLLGRVGRQGDKGEVLFLLSPDDDIIIKYGNRNKMLSILDNGLLKDLKDNQPILNSKLLMNSINKLQLQIEASKFDSRKYIVGYDYSLTKQREIIYGKRRKILTSDYNTLEKLIKEQIIEYLNLTVRKEEISDDISTHTYIYDMFNGVEIKIDNAKINDYIKENTQKLLNALKKLQNYFTDIDYDKFLQKILLNNIDSNWSIHLGDMSNLKTELLFIGNAQRDPIAEYNKGALQLFKTLNLKIIEQNTFLLQKLSNNDIFKLLENEDKEGKAKIINELIHKFSKDETDAILEDVMKPLSKEQLEGIWKNVKYDGFTDYTIEEGFRPIKRSILESQWNKLKALREEYIKKYNIKEND